MTKTKLCLCTSILRLMLKGGGGGWFISLSSRVGKAVRTCFITGKFESEYLGCKTQFNIIIFCTPETSKNCLLLESNVQCKIISIFRNAVQTCILTKNYWRNSGGTLKQEEGEERERKEKKESRRRNKIHQILHELLLHQFNSGQLMQCKQFLVIVP